MPAYPATSVLSFRGFNKKMPYLSYNQNKMLTFAPSMCGCCFALSGGI